METSEKKTEGQPRKVRGTALFRCDDSMEFIPQGEGKPVQKSVKKRGDSRFYETEGEKQSSYVCHLKVPKDSPDPVSEMFETLQSFTRSLVKKEPRQPGGKTLLDQEGVKVWHRKSENKVVVRMELTVEGAQPQLGLSSQLFNLTQQVNKCFAINKISSSPQK